MPDLATDLRLSYLHWLVSLVEAREERYRTFRDYYDGDHPTQLTDRQRRFLEVGTDVRFQTNLCPLVVDSLADKLEVTGFQCEGQDDTLWEWWSADGMDAKQTVCHLSAIRDGDAFLLVEWDQEQNRPRFSVEPAFDGGEGVTVVYSEEDRSGTPIRGLKRWTLDQGPDAGTLARMNVYYPDRVEKFVAQLFGGALVSTWAPWSDGDGESEFSWTDNAGVGFGVPLMHFRNKDQGYSYGQSEIEDVIPLVNALNKSVIDLIAAADTTGFRVYTMTGGDPSDVTIAPGSWIYSEAPDAKIGAIPGEDLAKLIELKDSIAQDIARVSRTPLSYFQIGGQVQAEGTLKQQEAGLIAKARNRQLFFGARWIEAMKLARRLANTFGDGYKLDEAAPIGITRLDPETRNEFEHLQGLHLKQALGVPQEQIWSEMGYDADTIERMQSMADAEQTRSVGNLAAGFLAQERSFDQGVDA